jgi:hypothetical protein
MFVFQVSTGHYCLEVNLGLLKLYKTYPSNCKDEFVQLVLVKSLMALVEKSVVQITIDYVIQWLLL